MKQKIISLKKWNNDLMSKINKNVHMVLNYIDYLHFLVSTITGCISVFSFYLLVGIHIGIASYAVGLKICVRTAGINK